MAGCRGDLQKGQQAYDLATKGLQHPQQPAAVQVFCWNSPPITVAVLKANSSPPLRLPLSPIAVLLMNCVPLSVTVALVVYSPPPEQLTPVQAFCWYSPPVTVAAPLT